MQDGVMCSDYSVTQNMYLGFKRIFDIVFSILAIILTSPIFLIIYIAIKLEDHDSVILVQERIGLNGKLFKLYKFRSMIVDADKLLYELLESNEVLALEYKINKKLVNDPRVTKVGKVIRKLSLDELPQLINILKGEMSFVGNRPYLPREKDEMKPYYNNIIKTKPGLTGLWAVSGRSNLTFKDRLKIESSYSEKLSLKLDIKIFFKTFAVVFKGL
jgi:undecaprenyl-phosphate galactose phosphotransferase